MDSTNNGGLTMIIDKQEHKALLLEVFKQVQFPGHILDLAYEVKKAIESAEVKEQPKD